MIDDLDRLTAGVRVLDPSDYYRYLELNCPVLDCPERRLLVAVLKDAVHTLQWIRPEKIQHRDTVRWFKSRSRESPFSFFYICDVLNISPTWILRKLQLSTDRSEEWQKERGSGMMTVSTSELLKGMRRKAPKEKRPRKKRMNFSKLLKEREKNRQSEQIPTSIES